MSRSQRKRLERLERKLAEVTGEALANCICKKFTGAYSPEIFKTEMNTRCPVHGFRRLGKILVTQVVGKKGEGEEKLRALHELVDEYERRLAQCEQADREQDYDSQQL